MVYSCCDCFKESLCHIVGVQFRNCATVGGSIYGRYGFSDVLTMFLGMDTWVECGHPFGQDKRKELNTDTEILVFAGKKIKILLS